MTRSVVKRLMFNIPLPKKRNEKILKYEEVYISPFGDNNWEDYKKRMEKIKKQYPEDAGWYCEGGICEGYFKENGRFFAYRYHGRYE